MSDDELLPNFGHDIWLFDHIIDRDKTYDEYDHEFECAHFGQLTTIVIPPCHVNSTKIEYIITIRSRWRDIVQEYLISANNVMLFKLVNHFLSWIEKACDFLAKVEQTVLCIQVFVPKLERLLDDHLDRSDVVFTERLLLFKPF